ncbi:hypothetical protein LIER_40775 [Lithospermum erythrorhizon]|uniref:Uncharacterized protein n=1 Tax=Lithospermum erythrorhizon TaxID=34254 RepID=A0AAV3R547_LITER
MMTSSAAFSTGIGLSSPWNFKKLDNNFGTQKPKWIISRNYSLRVIKMTASVDEKPKTFTLQKSEEAFTIAKRACFVALVQCLVMRLAIVQCTTPEE